MNNTKRRDNIERLRVLSTFAVVMIHICMTEVNNCHLNEIGITNYIIYSIGYDIVRWAVPVFIMITGYLLLNPNKDLSNSKRFQYIKRMVLVLLIFGTAYASIELVYTSGREKLLWILPNAFLKVLQMKSWDHLWYLYCLIGLYLITPLIKAAMKSINERQLWELLCISYILVFVIPAVNMATGLNICSFYFPFNQYLFYYLMGYYLSIIDNRIVNNRGITFIIGITSLLVMILWDSIKIFKFGDYSHWIRKANFLVPLLAVSIFVLFLSEEKFNAQLGKVLQSIARCSFGIYLIHPFYINLIYKFCKVTPASFPIVLGIFLLFALVFILSWLSSWILKKLPGFNKIL